MTTKKLTPNHKFPKQRNNKLTKKSKVTTQHKFPRIQDEFSYDVDCNQCGINYLINSSSAIHPADYCSRKCELRDSK